LAAVVQVRAVFSTQHGATAGREDARLVLRQFVQGRLLEVAEMLFAFPLEKLTDRAAKALLDHMVRIKEGKRQTPGKVTPDSGFS
jgi:hypothetical protein